MLLQERRLGFVAGAWLQVTLVRTAAGLLLASHHSCAAPPLNQRLQDHQGRPAHHPLLRFGAVHAADRDRPGRLREAPKSVRASRVAQNFGTRPVRARCSRGSLRVPAMTLSDCSSARACGRRVAPELDGRTHGRSCAGFSGSGAGCRAVRARGHPAISTGASTKKYAFHTNL